VTLLALVFSVMNNEMNDDNSGPTTVLVLSLLFIGFVVLLHIYGKLTSK
jgi:hypothetical protein